MIYDVRTVPTTKLKMKLRINDLCWNPMEPYHLSAASDDYNAYTFDIRKMDSTPCRGYCANTTATRRYSIVEFKS